MVEATDDFLEALQRHPKVRSAVVTSLPGSQNRRYRVVPTWTDAPPRFGLFYFSDQDLSFDREGYRLCIEGAIKADKLGLDAVWLPERHFTGVGAGSPNPSLICAALSVATRDIALRAGSVVLPLHHPVRVAEEWAVVDQLSNGRAGVSFASGWVPDDFIFAPDTYGERRTKMAHLIEQVQALWSGQAVNFQNGVGISSAIRIRPLPKQKAIPVWLTAAASDDTFALAGKLGLNVLTGLLQMSVEQLTDKISIYRRERLASGHSATGGNVTVMLHTFMLQDAADAESVARPALRSYFQAQSELRHAAAKAAGKPVGNDPRLSERMLSHSVERFIAERCLIGSPTSVRGLLDRLRDAGADEIACLIDFGVSTEAVLGGIDCIAQLRGSPSRQLETELAQLFDDRGAHSCTVEVEDP